MDRAYLTTWILGIVSIIGVFIVIAGLSFHPQPVISQEKQVAHQATGVTPKSIPQKIFTMKQISIHNNSSDCWIVVNKFVYDMSLIIKQYPSAFAANAKNFNAEKFCGQDQTAAIKSLASKFGINDLSQVNGFLSQYAVGKLP